MTSKPKVNSLATEALLGGAKVYFGGYLGWRYSRHSHEDLSLFSPLETGKALSFLAHVLTKVYISASTQPSEFIPWYQPFGAAEFWSSTLTTIQVTICVCMCVYIHMYMCVYIFIQHTHISEYTSVYIHTYTHLYKGIDFGQIFIPKIAI